MWGLFFDVFDFASFLLIQKISKWIYCFLHVNISFNIINIVIRRKRPNHMKVLCYVFSLWSLNSMFLYRLSWFSMHLGINKHQSGNAVAFQKRCNNFFLDCLIFKRPFLSIIFFGLDVFCITVLEFSKSMAESESESIRGNQKIEDSRSFLFGIIFTSLGR